MVELQSGLGKLLVDQAEEVVEVFFPITKHQLICDAKIILLKSMGVPEVDVEDNEIWLRTPLLFEQDPSLIISDLGRRITMRMTQPVGPRRPGSRHEPGKLNIAGGQSTGQQRVIGEMLLFPRADLGQQARLELSK